MSMRPDQWRPIAALIDNLWKDEFDEVREVAYFRALSHLNAEHVEQAIVNIAGNKALSNPRLSTGGTYLPAAQTIAVEAAAIARIGTWSWALDQVRRVMHDVYDVAFDRYEASGGEGESLPTAVDGVVPFQALVDRDPEWGPRLCDLIEAYGIAKLGRQGIAGDFERFGRRWWARRALGPHGKTAGELAEVPR